MALETNQNNGRHLPVDSNLLKNERFLKKHTVSLTPSHPPTFTSSQVFACSDAEDYKRPFRESEMNRLIEVHINSILLYITIPPPPQKREGEITFMVCSIIFHHRSAGTERGDNGPD